MKTEIKTGKKKEKTLLDSLNEEQRRAVTTVRGPILIVAGAGTGKTRVITHRIAHIVESYAKAEGTGVLAMAFSREAAAEMTTRVEGLLGKRSDEVMISTFHSFCNTVLHDHALDAGLSPNFRLLDEAEASLLLKRAISKLKLDYYFNLSDPAAPTDSFIRFISRCKDEMVSPPQLYQYAKLIKDAEERSRMLEVADVYKVYQNALKKSNSLDIAGLIEATLELFRRRSSVLREYQEQYKYILVDEFQDTNVAQIELLTLLADCHRNICAVGDDDQAIYRFRGASFASFIKFKDYFPEGINLRLTQNYRSTKKILSMSGRLIEGNNPDRFDPNKKLWTKNSEGDRTSLIIAGSYEEEACSIAREIESIRATLPTEDRDYSNFAVLFRAHSHKEELLKVFSAREIPHVVVGSGSFFESEGVRDLISLFKAVADPHDNLNLFRVLSIPTFGLEMEDLIELSRHAKRNNVPLWNVVRASVCKKLISAKGFKSLKYFMEMIQGFMRQAETEDVRSLFCDMVIEKTDLLKGRLLLKDGISEEDELGIVDIGQFYSIVCRYAQNHVPSRLKDFLVYLDSYIRMGRSRTEPSGLPSGVRLMTIHRAKGLEFPYVFIMSMVQNRFPMRLRPDQIPFPLKLIKEELPKGDFHNQEERRLLYVALTRAMKRVTLTSVEKPYHKPSVFLNELRGTGGSAETRDIDERRASSGSEGDRLGLGAMLPLFSDEATTVLRGKLRVISLIDDALRSANKREPKELLKDIEGEIKTLSKVITHAKPAKPQIPLGTTSVDAPDELRLSYTKIDTYRSCPLKYKFSYIYSVPIKPTPRLLLGTNVHAALEGFYHLVGKGKRATGKEMKEIFMANWRDEGFTDKAESSKWKKQGLEILMKFYQANKDDLKPPIALEKKFTFALEGCKVTGYIDRIDSLPEGGAEIIDYKTSVFKQQRSAEKSFQLAIYAIASREVLDLEPKALSIYYLMSNKKVTTYKEEEELISTRKIIQDVADKIKKRLFEPHPGYNCKWCDYKIICPAAKK
ncbi:MAG: UvrD-helicase domain-containing protein [Candidatus Omnitrophica bacterium]|nr:UvrD-helicase domain-containing protein [Candidatus Omnitrophota bacterium]